MTSQSDRIQSLVNQINTILTDTPAADGSMADEYRVLEQTRQQLTQLQQSPTATLAEIQPAIDGSQTSDGSQMVVNDWQTPAPVLAESAQQVLQAIVQEMAYLRMNTVQPLREDVTRLQQERSYLATEVQQLQQQRQQLILAQQTDQQQMINGFLHALMGQLQEQLTVQVAQTMVRLNGDTTMPLVSAGSEQVVQLDSTLKVLFDSLQSSVDTYQDSLEQSLRKMHGLGQQGEAMFTAFVNRLAGQLGREASLHLRPAPSADWELPSDEGADRVTEALAGANTDALLAADQEVVADQDDDSKTNVSDLASDLATNDEIEPAYLEQLLAEPMQEASAPLASPVASSEEGIEDISNEAPSGIIDTQMAGSELSAGLASGSSGAIAQQPFQGSTDNNRTDNNPAADRMIDQIIGKLENNTIDAAAAIDNLDLGFGLDGIELADVPMEESASASIGAGSDAQVQTLDDNGLNQLAQNPIQIASGLELDAPLDPIANLRIDQDESDVDRLMAAINQPVEEQDVTDGLPSLLLDSPEETISNHPLLNDYPVNADPANIQGLTGTQAQVSAVGGIADVTVAESQTDDTARDSDNESDFLLQQLASELSDDLLGEEFLGESPSREAMETAEGSASSDAASFMNDESTSKLGDRDSISFQIAEPADGATRESATETATAPIDDTSRVEDFYAPFTVASTPLSASMPSSPVGDVDEGSSMGVNTSLAQAEDDAFGLAPSLDVMFSRDSSERDSSEIEAPDAGMNDVSAFVNDSDSEDDDNAWSAWTNHLDNDPGVSPDAESGTDTSVANHEASAAPVETIHQLSDLIDLPGSDATRDPLDTHSNASTNPSSDPLSSDVAYRSPVAETEVEKMTDLFGGAESSFDDLPFNDGTDDWAADNTIDWGGLGDTDPEQEPSNEALEPALTSEIDQLNPPEAGQSETNLPPVDSLADLDLRLDETTMSQLASDLSNSDLADSPLESGASSYGDEGLESLGRLMGKIQDPDETVPMPPPLVGNLFEDRQNTSTSSNHFASEAEPASEERIVSLPDFLRSDLETEYPSADGNLEGEDGESNAIESLQNLFENGAEDETSPSGAEASDAEASIPTMQDFFSGDASAVEDGAVVSPETPSDTTTGPSEGPTLGDMWGPTDELSDPSATQQDLESSESSFSDDLTPVSWTIEELLSGELPSSPPAPEPAVVDPEANGRIRAENALEENALEENALEENDLQQAIADDFEDDGLANLLQDLQGDAQGTGPLTGVEEAKTLADLLRQSASSPKDSTSTASGDPSPDTTTDALASWFGDDSEDVDGLSNLEKKNN